MKWLLDLKGDVYVSIIHRVGSKTSRNPAFHLAQTLFKVWRKERNNQFMAKHHRKAVTIKDVASRSGVSVATASRAINRRGYVSSQTQLKVLQAVRELGYKPSAAARSLKLQRTNTIGLMIADVVNPFYSYLADGVLDCAKRTGYHVILCATDEDPSTEEEYLQVLMEKRVDGIIAVPTGHNLKLWREAIDLGTELVFVDREVPGISESSVVLVDNVKGTYDAVVYLIGLGHQRIGIICGPGSTTTGKGRLQGYCQAFEEAQLPIDEEMIQIGSFKRESGFQAAQRLLEIPEPPTAIFAANNVLGEAAMFAIRDRGLNIPDDISFVIFDDVPWASLTTPQVTAVAQPTHSLGFLGMELLVQRLQKAHKAGRTPRKIVLQPEFIVRESCAAYPRPHP
jgi:LacI family transcriptional regulator